MKKWYAIHNGKRIGYLLGIAIGFDQFLHSFVPRADIDRTISHRLGVKKLKKAIRRGLVSEVWMKRIDRPLPPYIKSQLYPIRLHGLPGLIDRALDKIDTGHTVDAVGQ
jgi:hypothetical protein